MATSKIIKSKQDTIDLINDLKINNHIIGYKDNKSNIMCLCPIYDNRMINRGTLTYNIDENEWILIYSRVSKRKMSEDEVSNWLWITRKHVNKFIRCKLNQK